MPLFGLLAPNIKKLKHRRDVKGLMDALQWARKDKSVAAAAACALGEIGDPRAVPSLCESLRWGDVRSVAEALAAIGDDSAVESLIWAMGRATGTDRQAVAASLATFSTKMIKEATRLTELGQQACRVAILALTSLRDDLRVVEPLVKAFREAAESERKEILRTLIGFGERVIDPLEKLLGDSKGGGRHSAVLVLEWVCDSSTAIRLLTPLLDEDLWGVVTREALRVLQARGWKPKTVAQRVSVAALSGNWAKAIAQAEGSIETFLAVADRLCSYDLQGLLLALARVDPSWPSKVSSAVALSILKKTLDCAHGDEVSRLAAVSALGEITAPTAADLLIDSLRTGGSESWKASMASLRRLGTHSIGPLVRALKEHESFAADMLVDMGSLAVDALIRALQDASICRQAAKVLGRIKDERAVQPLADILNSRSIDDAWGIAHALGEIGGLAATRRLVKVALAKNLIGSEPAIAALGPNSDVEAVGALVRILRTEHGTLAYRAADSLKRLLPGKEALVSLKDLYTLVNLADPHVSQIVSSDYSWDMGKLEFETLDLSTVRAWAQEVLNARGPGV